jgi:hypothetical protein
MALLTATAITRAGVDTAGVAADVAGDTFANNGREYAIVKNGSASPITVTLDAQVQVDGQAVVDRTVTINAGIEKIIGPFPTGIYNDANGQAKITYSAVTSVTTKILSVPG